MRVRSLSKAQCENDCSCAHTHSLSPLSPSQAPVSRASSSETGVPAKNLREGEDAHGRSQRRSSDGKDSKKEKKEVRTHIHTHPCVYECIYVKYLTYIREFMLYFIYDMYIHICIYTYMYIYTYICMDIHVCICIYVSIYVVCIYRHI